MTKLAWLIVATMIGSGVFVAAPASAQVQFGVGPEGPSVRIGPDDDRVIERRRRIERRGYGDDLVTGNTGRCKTVTIREEDDNGDMVTRRVRRCR
jgi:hypothetical protein